MLDDIIPYQYKPGQSGNPGGRPKSGLKDFDRRKFQEMTDEEKAKFLDKLDPGLRYRMAEGNPAQEQEMKGNLTINVIQYEDNDPA